jgi:cytochrome c oxidase cbb3-type subunit 3
VSLARGAVLTLTIAACQNREQSAPAHDSGRVVPPSVRYDQHLPAADLAPLARTLSNPVRGDARAATLGESLFAGMNCDGCHGGGALGFVGPSLADGRWRYGGEDGAIFHSIYYGRPKGMPAYGGLLSDTTIWQLVTYVHSLPRPGVVPTQAWP